MNKYQKKKSKEIKALQRHVDKWGRLSYKEAKREWQAIMNFPFFHPCENCCTIGCRNIGKPIAYCPERR